MARIALVLPLLIVVSVVLAACGSASSVDIDDTVDIGDTLTTQDLTPAADFSAVDVVTGESIMLSQFTGSVVLLNLVSYGCNPSQGELVSKQLLAIRDLVEQGVDFVPLSVFCSCCLVDVLRDFAQQNDLDWPWILDSDYSIASKYGQYLAQFGYPTLVFIDRGQTIRDVAGYLDAATLRTRIDQVSR